MGDFLLFGSVHYVSYSALTLLMGGNRGLICHRNTRERRSQPQVYMREKE